MSRPLFLDDCSPYVSRLFGGEGKRSTKLCEAWNDFPTATYPRFVVLVGGGRRAHWVARVIGVFSQLWPHSQSSFSNVSGDLFCYLKRLTPPFIEGPLFTFHCMFIEPPFCPQRRSSPFYENSHLTIFAWYSWCFIIIFINDLYIFMYI